MKKVLLIISALVIAFNMSAQSKEKVLKALDKAQAATMDAKKGEKPATWIKLSDAYLKVYKAERNGLTVGMNKSDVKQTDILSSEVKNINGTNFIVDTYADKVLYYTEEQTLRAIIITESFLGKDKNPLQEAMNALLTAIEKDVKQSKYGSIEGKLQNLRNVLIGEADAAYSVGDYAYTAQCYIIATKCSDNDVVGMVDDIMVYSAAVTSHMAGDLENAKKYYKQAIEVGYAAKGDVYASLAELYVADKEYDKAKALLNEGFQKYPDNQIMLITLINVYMDTNDDVNKIIDLLHVAQSNEPNNATLYLAEGNVYKEQGDSEKAIAAYNKAYEVNPSYGWSIFSVGAVYFDRAVDLQTAISELPLDDQEGYDRLTAEFESALLNAIEPFEKAFEGAGEDMELKVSAADVLKQIYFRFREKDAKYAEGYEKYNAFLEANK